MYGGESSGAGAQFDFGAPVHFGSLFGPDSDDDADEQARKQQQQSSNEPVYAVQTHAFPDGHVLRIREFDDHVTNANAVWPEARFLAGWLCAEQPDGSVDRQLLRRRLIDGEEAANLAAPFAADSISTVNSLPPAAASAAAFAAAPPSALAAVPPAPHPDRRMRVLELGAACGALSIFLARCGVRMTASDIDDAVVMANLRANATLNGLSEAQLPVLPHTWGQNLDVLRRHLESEGSYDAIIASDILNYEKAFPDLVATLCVLMPRPQEASAAGAAAPAATVGAPAIEKSAGVSSHATSAASSLSLAPCSSSLPSACPSCTLHMVWKRRAKGRAQEADFFSLLREANFNVHTDGEKVFRITRC
jgi:2-polyprenyl-3-methyl-5-hydroxy-6-metoxy-1,4-benzoquinol methylase